MPDFDIALSDDIQFLIACLIGSCVRAFHEKAPINLRSFFKKAGDIISGIATGWYIGPILVHLLPERIAATPGAGPAVGFIVGYIAAELCGFLLTVVTEIMPAIARWWIAIRASAIPGPSRPRPEDNKP